MTVAAAVHKPLDLQTAAGVCAVELVMGLVDYGFMTLKTIVLEDEPLVAETIADMLRGLGHHVCGVAHDGRDLPRLLSEHEPELVTIDVQLGGGRDGIGVATLLESGGCLPIVFITGAVDEQEQEEILAIEGATLLYKPFTADQLAEAIAAALQRAQEDCAPELGPS